MPDRLNIDPDSIPLAEIRRRCDAGRAQVALAAR
jgi:hypothetical protein